MIFVVACSDSEWRIYLFLKPDRHDESKLSEKSFLVKLDLGIQV